MTDNKTDGLDPNKKVGTIPFDAVINVKVSGFYYARVLQLVTAYAEQNQIDFLKCIEELKTREPATPAEYNLVTLMSLCHAIETGAVEQNLVVEKKLGEIIPDPGTAPGN